MTKYLFRIVSSLLLAMIVTQPAFSQESVLLQVFYGGYATECSWEVVNKLDGNVLLSGGPGLVDNTFSQNGNVSLYPGEYVFKAYDSESDGWTSAAGWYQIVPSSGISTGQVYFPSGDYQETDFTVLSSSTTELGMVSWVSPVSSASLTSSENITVQLRNYGSAAVNGFSLKYSINGGTSFVTQSYTGSVNSGELVNFTFSQSANFAASGTYDCMAIVTATGDLIANNDTVNSEIISLSSISSFPWSENFSTWPPANWTFDGVNDWASYSNSSAFCNFFYWQGESAQMITPALNLYNPATLNFSWSSGYSYQAPNDEFHVLISTDNCATWDTVWSKTGIDLFSNDGALDVSPGSFVQESIDLTAFENNVVNVKFTGVSGYGYNLFVDNVSVTMNPINDLALVEWVYPANNACGLSSAENVTVRIKNKGASNVTNYTVAYSIDGGANYITESVSSLIPAGGFYDYTFTATANFSTVGQFICSATVTATGDFNISNNSLNNVEISHLGTINTFPYSEDFESGNTDWGFASERFGEVSLNYFDSNYAIKLEGGASVIWDSSNTNKPWAGSSSATTETEAWNTNSVFHSSTQSCMVDATQLSTVELLFDLKQFYRTGTNFTWLRVLVNGVPVTSDQGIQNFHPQTSYSDPFTTHRFDLSSYAGTQFTITFQGCNKFNSLQYAPGNVSYIDNIVIQELDPPDAAIVSLVSPESGCGLTSTESIEVQLQNLGGASISNFDLSYSINGGIFVSNTVSTIVESGNTLNYSFPQTADLSTLGQYIITIAIALQDDIDNTNDTLSFLVEHSAPVTVSISGLNSFYCLYDPDVSLTGSPVGGIFSGDGIVGSSFNPTDAGPGSHVITYSYFDALTGCSNVSTQSVTVTGSEVSFSGLYSGPALVPVLVQVYYNSNWPQEQSWEIVDDAGTVFLSSPSGTSTYGYSYNGTIYLPFGNYKFIAHDTYGDGWNNSWWEITPNFGTGTGFSNYTVSLSQQPKNSIESIFEVGGTVSLCLSNQPLTLTGTPSGGTFSGPGVNGNTFNPLLAGVGTHTITYTASAGGCIGVENQQVIIEASPSVDLGPNQVGCEGDVVILNAGIAASYTWSNGATTSTINVLQTGQYAVTVSSNGGCESIDQVDIQINPLPIVDLGANQDKCDGDLVSLNAGIADNYIWSNGATVSLITVSTDGTYSVTVTNQLCEASDVVTISFHSVNVDLGPDLEICSGATATLDAGSGSFFQYNWSGGEQTQSIQAATSGTYYVTVTDQYGCNGSDDMNIIVNPLPLIDLGPDMVIDDTVIILDAGVGYASYLWSTGSVSMILPVDGNLLALGSYTYWVEITNSYGCTSTDTITITKESSQAVQSIVLVNGWSMISSYIDPFEADLIDVFADVVTKINIVKDGNGNVYWPTFNFNNVGDLTIGEGYQIFMNAADTLEVVGIQVQPELSPFTIPSGWSIMGYLRTSPASLVDMLSNVVLNVEIVKDGNGNVYWPSFQYNGIGNMLPGGGYQILSTNSFLFTYPANTTKSQVSWSNKLEPTYFHSCENTGHNMTLAIPRNVAEGILNVNDEIAVFDQNGVLLGSSVYQNSNIILTIWGNNPYTNSVDGIQEGQEFTLKKWDRFSYVTTDLKVDYFISGSAVYSVNSQAVIGKFASVNTEGISLSNYPNPFRDRTTIEFYLPESMDIRILLYNLVGEFVQEICTGNYPEGVHNVELNGGSLQAGIYYYTLETPNKYITEKLCMEK
ncbi:MAG: T9SS type A sorting domain-containing protein [Bacteroidales bacterium]|nr:T9SS type A sorting domain-containing protein [Bacteroidales bacterium]MCF8457680.1 T9SS type A sorting domain-containing protein [Bacteroidales bacterium]